MHQTLVIIPHAWLGAPLFYGWLVAGALVFLIWGIRRGFAEPLGGFFPVYVVGALVLKFVVPHVEISGVNPLDPNGPLQVQGLAIRGYGLFLTLGIIAGMWLCLKRGRQVGIHPDKIIALCFWMVVIGIIGARLFFVIQKWDSYSNYSIGELLPRILDMTEGGLVVFGGLFGGVIAWVGYCRIQKLNLLLVADIFAPGFMIGLALGRIGCLMNGCCFGGACELPVVGAHFPAGSPPYLRQVETGELLGLELKSEEKGEGGLRTVSAVAAGSPAEQAGLAIGDEIRAIGFPEDFWFRAILIQKHDVTLPERSNVVIDRIGHPPLLIPIATLPSHSASTHPTQIYSAVNALLLCGLLWFYYPYRVRDGEVFAAMLVLYSLSRFLLEMIRVDEYGQFGSQFSISQWVSMIVFPVGLLLWGYLRSSGRKQTRSA